jgi:hypothetical protein
MMSEVLMLPISQQLLDTIGQGLTQLPYYIAEPAIKEMNSLVNKAVKDIMASRAASGVVMKPGQEAPQIDPPAADGPAPGLSLVDKQA